MDFYIQTQRPDDRETDVCTADEMHEAGVDTVQAADEQLIAELRAGSSEKMEYLLEKYKPLVRKEANMMFLIGGETEDLIQEGMIGLFKAVRDYDSQKESSFAGFARLCVRRQMYSAVKISNRRKNQPLNSYVPITGADGETPIEIYADSVENPEEQVVSREYTRLLMEQIKNDLSEMEQEVLQYYLDGNSYIQIAEKMNRPPKSIDNTLQRIRRKVRVVIEAMDS